MGKYKIYWEQVGGDPNLDLGNLRKASWGEVTSKLKSEESVLGR